MRIYYAGAESPTHRRRLIAAGAEHFSVSYWHLRDRLPKDGSFPFAERFPAGAKIMLDSGGYTANAKRGEFDDDHWVDYLDAYVDLASDNVGALDLVTEFDFLDYSVTDLWALRYDVWQKTIPPEKFMPVWHAEHGFEELEALCSSYPQVAIPAEEVKQYADRLPALSNRYGVRIHGLAVTSQKLIARAVLDSVSSTSWVSPTRHGDRVVWEHGTLHRYPAKYADRVPEKHANLLEREGFDVGLISDGDPEELTRLTVWSMEQWSAHLARAGGVTTSRAEPTDEDVDCDDEGVGTPDSGRRNSALVPRPRDEVSVLPIIHAAPGQQQQVVDGEMVTVEGPVEISVPRASQRQCDPCYIRSLCPKFEPGASCAFDIPVEIRTKEQLTAFLSSMLEIQSQRVLFARYAEELEGGYPTERVSEELDRMMAMTAKVADIQDTRDFMRVSIEARAQGGVLSRIFGEEYGRRAVELDNPVNADNAMAEIVDAVIEE